MTETKLEEITKNLFLRARKLALPLGILLPLSCNTNEERVPEKMREEVSPIISEEEVTSTLITIGDIPDEKYTCPEKIISNNSLSTFCLYPNYGAGGAVFSRDGRIAILGDISFNNDSSDIIRATFEAYILDSVTKEAKRILLPNVSGRVTGISHDGDIFVIGDYKNITAKTTPVVVDIANKTRQEISSIQEPYGTTFFLSPDGNTIAWTSEYTSAFPYEVFAYDRTSKEIRRLTENQHKEDYLFSFSDDGTSLLFFSDKDLTDEQKEKDRDFSYYGYELYALNLNTLNETRITECQKSSRHANTITWKDETTISYYCMDYENKKHTKYEFKLKTNERKEVGQSEDVRIGYANLDIHQTNATVWVEDWLDVDIRTWTAYTPKTGYDGTSYEQIKERARKAVGAKSHEKTIEDKDERTPQASYSNPKQNYNPNDTSTADSVREDKKTGAKRTTQKKRKTEKTSGVESIIANSPAQNISIQTRDVVGGKENDVFIEINGTRYYKEIDGRPVEDWLPTYMTREKTVPL